MSEKDNRQELRRKLIRAKDIEEVRAILGPETAEEEINQTWREIEAHRPAEGLEAVDDDELEAVSGGGEEAANGHEVGCWAGIFWYADWKEANKKCCAENSEGGWEHDFRLVRQFSKNGTLLAEEKCKYCGYTQTFNPGMYW